MVDKKKKWVATRNTRVIELGLGGGGELRENKDGKLCPMLPI